jgi:hypothetical protein
MTYNNKLGGGLNPGKSRYYTLQNMLPYGLLSENVEDQNTGIYLRFYLLFCTNFKCGPGQRSQYHDSLRAGRAGDRIPVAARFFAPVLTGPGAHPASYTMGSGSISRG